MTKYSFYLITLISFLITNTVALGAACTSKEGIGIEFGEDTVVMTMDGEFTGRIPIFHFSENKENDTLTVILGYDDPETHGLVHVPYWSDGTTTKNAVFSIDKGETFIELSCDFSK